MEEIYNITNYLLQLKKIRESLKILGQTIIDVTDPDAKILGSDVFFTGKLLI